MYSRILVFSFLLASISQCFGQATGTITGSVTDRSGAVIPAASVIVTNQETNQVRDTTADDTGKFTLTFLPVGTYSVRVDKEGFGSSVRKDVLLQVNTTVQTDAQLEVRSTSEQIQVTAEASLVQATSTTLVQVVDTRRVQDLPLNGRNVLNLMQINAGVSTEGATGQTNQIQNLGTAVTASINGSRGNGTNFLLDNGDNNDGYTNTALPFPNPDAVQEFSIQTSTFDAQYGRGVGGVVNVVTKSGTNRVHGSLFEYLRNYELNAANFFSGRDTVKRNQFGGSFGGPVVLPKLYNG
ncbi:MAG TPA: carboxypeptidase-like regulatory domain-containing protein, partial [Bryobacteraceae bacterium]|nr:carboxypeptidase-like regulatory domain-containing protein [Bryobacteraceae bacterium]